MSPLYASAAILKSQTLVPLDRAWKIWVMPWAVVWWRKFLLLPPFFKTTYMDKKERCQNRSWIIDYFTLSFLQMEAGIIWCHFNLVKRKKNVTLWECGENRCCDIKRLANVLDHLFTQVLVCDFEKLQCKRATFFFCRSSLYFSKKCFITLPLLHEDHFEQTGNQMYNVSGTKK